MKTSTYEQINNPPQYRMGALYINRYNVIIICSENSGKLCGSILYHDTITEIGRYVTDIFCEYTEFHGTITLTN